MTWGGPETAARYACSCFVPGIEYTKIAVDVNAGENRSNELLAMNPNGLVPVLVDKPVTAYDSAAILSCQVKVYADDDWFPIEPTEFLKVIRWLTFEQSERRYGLARARAIFLNNPMPLARSGTLEDAQALARVALETLNEQLMETKMAGRR